MMYAGFPVFKVGVGGLHVDTCWLYCRVACIEL